MHDHDCMNEKKKQKTTKTSSLNINRSGISPNNYDA